MKKTEGVSASIMTGIEAAHSEIVCSMDCDCSYDPFDLLSMIPQLTSDVDLVTASPYHPEGQVKNVPGWRLFLSRGASFLYRKLIGGGLHTYTSCFRVYRKSSLQNLQMEEDHFLGVAELLCQLIQQNRHIVEYPTTLHLRLFGHSKIPNL